MKAAWKRLPRVCGSTYFIFTSAALIAITMCWMAKDGDDTVVFQFFKCHAADNVLGAGSRLVLVSVHVSAIGVDHASNDCVIITELPRLTIVTTVSFDMATCGCTASSRVCKRKFRDLLYSDTSSHNAPSVLQRILNISSWPCVICLSSFAHLMLRYSAHSA